MSDHENVLRIGRPGGYPQDDPDGRLGSILLEEGKLQAADLDHVVALQRVEGLRFGDAAVRLELITADDLRRAIARQYGFPHLLPGDHGVSRELVTALEPDHSCAEEMRTLRTQIVMRWRNAGKGEHMLAVVSAARGEGRSFVVANLAVVFAQLGERTLLVDADLRSPRQHRIFNIDNRVGLSAALTRRAERNGVMTVPAFGPLSVVPAGPRPPNPQELLLRPAFVALLDEWRDSFDVILFDTPPAQRFADAQSVAFRAGSALVVTRKGRTRVNDVNLVIRDLGETGASIVGTLFNAF